MILKEAQSHQITNVHILLLQANRASEFIYFMGALSVIRYFVHPTLPSAFLELVDRDTCSCDACPKIPFHSCWIAHKTAKVSS